jgi:hypothetical protein
MRPFTAVDLDEIPEENWMVKQKQMREAVQTAPGKVTATAMG